MRKILYIFIILFFIFFSLPFLASTSLGNLLAIDFLQTRFSAKITIEKLHFSWLGPQKLKHISFQKDALLGEIEEFQSTVPFWQLSHAFQAFQLQNASFSQDGQTLQNVNAKINGHTIFATGTTPNGGSLLVQGTMTSKTDFDVTASLTDIPTGIFHQPLLSALGPSFSLNGSMTYKADQGSLILDLSSQNGGAFLNGEITNQILTLKEPFLATLRITDPLSAFILQHIDPQFITNIEGKDPIILRIFTKDFQCPLSPFSLSQLEIGSGVLDMGRVQVTPGSSLSSFLKLFKNTNFSNSVPIWFTSVAIKLESGVLETGRMDALIGNSTHICTWGDLDIGHNELNLRLGLPADTLEKSFHIQNLAKNYVLVIPVRGSLNNPEIITGPAIAKIATMSVSQQIPTKGGKIFGNIVGAFTQAQEDEKAPPPNRPFPWEK